jgi:hypothetical protein
MLFFHSFFFFLVVLGFELRASHLLSLYHMNHSTAPYSSSPQHSYVRYNTDLGLKAALRHYN